METCKNINESLTNIQNLVVAQRTARIRLEVAKLDNLAKIITKNVAFLSTGNDTEIYDELEQIKLLSIIIEDSTVADQFLLNFYIREKLFTLEKLKAELEKSCGCKSELIKLNLLIDKIKRELCKFPKIKLTCVQFKLVVLELESEINLLLIQPKTPQIVKELLYTSKFLQYLKRKYSKCDPCLCK